jgi:hypothetical protein
MISLCLLGALSFSAAFGQPLPQDDVGIDKRVHFVFGNSLTGVDRVMQFVVRGSEYERYDSRNSSLRRITLVMQQLIDGNKFINKMGNPPALPG